MSVEQAPCPKCAAELAVGHPTTVSVVCPQCNGIFRREPDELRPLGQLTGVFSTRSPLEIGMVGSYRGTSFQITGHVHLSNEGDATWDEYYLGFDDGQCGWLAHAQGKLLLTFPSSLPPGMPVPPLESLQLDQPLPLMPGMDPLYLAEKGLARVLVAGGQIPYLLMPGETYAFADFAAMSGAFATLDYGDNPPTLYVGREVTLEELDLEISALDIPTDPGDTLYCTECGQRLEVHVPGKTQRITCLECRTLFDISRGPPQVVDRLGELQSVRPFVPIGAVGQLSGGDLRVIGFLQRSTVVEGITYYWEEYLLYHPEGRYAWLVQSDKHWTLFEPVNAGGEIQSEITHGGKPYKLFQHGPANITYVEGEFYWKVNAGQVTYTADFIHPPHMLSVEYAPEDELKGESNWTHGTYLPLAEVETAFGVTGLPRPTLVGPNQPFPHSGIYGPWLAGFAILLVIGLFFLFTMKPETVFQDTINLDEATLEENPDPAAPADEKRVRVVTRDIDLKGGRNIKILARADMQSTWVHVTGYIIDEDTLVMQPFDIPISHYSGDADGERWSEGDKSEGVYLSSLPAGKYKLKLGLFKDEAVGPQPPASQPLHFQIGERTDPAYVKSIEIRIEQGSPRWWHLIAALIALSLIPFIVWLMQMSFEKRRWENSNVGPASS